MQGASRSALVELHGALPDSGDRQAISDQLFAVVSLLSNQGSLRRALTDPSSPAEQKAGIVDRLLTDKLDEATLALVRTAAQSRWSQPRDMVDGIEEVAVDAALAVAEEAGSLDEVEDELFRFERIIDSEPELRAALTDRNLPADLKRDLLHRLLDGKVTDVTLSLLERAVIEPRGRTLKRAITDLSRLAARRRDRLVAHVTSAVELTDEEQRDLTAALGRAFDHDVKLQVVVDPALLGGLTVRVGDELIDGSVARQLDEARRKLTGKSADRRT